jgi:hypothetical protein
MRKTSRFLRFVPRSGDIGGHSPRFGGRRRSLRRRIPHHPVAASKRAGLYPETFSLAAGAGQFRRRGDEQGGGASGVKDQEPLPGAPHVDAARTRIRKGVLPKRRWSGRTMTRRCGWIFRLYPDRRGPGYARDRHRRRNRSVYPCRTTESVAPAEITPPGSPQGTPRGCRQGSRRRRAEAAPVAPVRRAA